MKKKKTTKINILLSSFTEKKYSLYNQIQKIKTIYSPRSKLFIGNMKKSIYHEFFKNFLLTPRHNNANKLKILGQLKKNKIGIVIPTSDKELNFWSKNIIFFNSHNIKVLIMENKMIKEFLDKKNFYYFCKKNNILTPEIYDFKDLDQKIRVVVKERRSDSNKKLLINFNKNKIKSGLKKFKNPLIQKYVTGEEFSIDTWRDKKSKKVELVVRKRSLVEGGDSKITEIIKDSKIIRNIENQISKFNYYYHCLFQGILSKGKFYFLECNPRIGGATVASFEFSLKTLHYFFSEIYQKKIIYKKRKFKRQYKFETAYYK